MRILFVGDIDGKPGRRIASQVIPRLRIEEKIDFVIANCENAAGGFGVTLNILKKLLSYKIDCLTSGNHIWDREEIMKYLSDLPMVLRPANYYNVPGRSSAVFGKIGVMCLLGRSYLVEVDCPFRAAIKEIDKLNTNIIIVDFHAESVEEKKALAYFLDGKVSAVIGTHTHVQTADEKILPKGTAYITDVGMTGSFASVIGVLPRKSINYFIYSIPQRFDSARGDEHLNGVIIDIDYATGKAVSIKRIII